jgi:hypothetical protein
MPGRKGRIRAFEFALPKIVEAVVVIAGEPGRAYGVLPHPLPEAVLDLLLFLPRDDRLILVDHPPTRPGVYCKLVYICTIYLLTDTKLAEDRVEYVLAGDLAADRRQGVGGD